MRGEGIMTKLARCFFTVPLSFVSLLVLSAAAMAGDPYEPNDTRETAWPVNLSIREIITTEKAELPSAEDLDWYIFEGIGGTWVTITCRPYQGLDVEMTIYDGDKVIGTFNDAGKDGKEVAEMVPIGADGAHYICVGRPGTGDTTDNETNSYYRLELEFHSDPYEITSFPQSFAYHIINYTVESDGIDTVYETFVLEGGNVFTRSDTDCYRFWADKGDLITVTCGFGENFNGAIRITDLYYGFSKTANDNGIGGDETLVDVIAPESNFFFIMVGSVQNGNLFSSGRGTSRDEEYSYPAEYTLSLTVKEAGSEPTSIITGTVRDSSTGEPIKYLELSAYSAAIPGVKYSDSTDTAGTYTIDVGPREGTFIVASASSRYFNDCVRDVHISPGETAVVDMELLKREEQKKTLLVEVYTSTENSNGGFIDGMFDHVEQFYTDEYVVLKYYESEDLATASDDEFIDRMARGVCTHTVDRFRFYDEPSYALSDDQTGDIVSKIQERDTWLPSFEIEAENSFDPASRMIDLDITLKPLVDLDRTFRLNVVVSEDSLNYAQMAYVNSVKMELYPYYHNDVVREMVTGALGEPLNDGPIEEGKPLMRHYSFPLPDSCTAKNSNIVVFVHEDLDDGIGPVQHAVKVPVTSGMVFIDSASPAPFSVSPPYPNPFNPVTTIEFSLAEAGNVNLFIYNVAGQKIRELLSSYKAPGTYRVVWDGCDSSGSAISNGVYFFSLTAGKHTATGKLTYLK